MSTAVLAAVFCGASTLASAQIVILTESVVERQATSGAGYGGIIRVKNTAAIPHNVRVYQTDYLFSADGANIFGPAASAPRSNARWVTFTPDYVTIPAGQTVGVQYSVKVPSGGQPLTGTYWSMLMVETVASGSPEAPGSSSTAPQMGLVTKMRYGVQVVTHVAGSSSMELAFSNISLAAPQGDRSATLSLDVSNAGERGARPRMSLELYDATGRLVGKFDQQRGLLFPGTSLRQQFQLGALPRGSYKAVVFADAGGDEIFVGQYDVTL